MTWIQHATQITFSFEGRPVSASDTAHGRAAHHTKHGFNTVRAQCSRHSHRSCALPGRGTSFVPPRPSPATPRCFTTCVGDLGIRSSGVLNVIVFISCSCRHLYEREGRAPLHAWPRASAARHHRQDISRVGFLLVYRRKTVASDRSPGRRIGAGAVERPSGGGAGTHPLRIGCMHYVCDMY